MHLTLHFDILIGVVIDPFELRDLDMNYKVELKANYGSNEEYLKATTKIFEDLQENLIDLQQELIKAVTYIYNLDNIKSLEKYTYTERFAVYLIKGSL